MKRKDMIKDFIKGCTSEQKVEIWNAYCETINCTDEMIYSTDDINELFAGLSPIEILQLPGPDFSLADDWFRADAYGNLYSASSVYYLIQDELDDVAAYIDEHHSALGCQVLSDRLLEDMIEHAFDETAAD